jgi:Holliday junction DNA helicase RuvA
MLHYIRGNVTMKFDGGVVIEAGGIGYEVLVPDNSPVYLYKQDEPALIYTEMIVREDDVSLYGFADRESLELFKQLITVSGVGAKVAMAILSAMSASELKQAIVFGDHARLTAANGVGKKTAQRIVLELKDKLDSIGFGDAQTPGHAETAGVQAAQGDEKTTALNALVSLGYSRAEALGALSSVSGDDLTAEQYIKAALKNLF